MGYEVVGFAAEIVNALSGSSIQFGYRETNIGKALNDARAALNHLRQQVGDTKAERPVICVGYSFGSRVAAALANEIGAKGYVGIAMLSGVTVPSCRSMVVSGAREANAAKLEHGKTIEVFEVDQADHFFKGKQDELKKALQSAMDCLFKGPEVSSSVDRSEKVTKVSFLKWKVL